MERTRWMHGATKAAKAHPLLFSFLFPVVTDGVSLVI